MSNSIEKRSLQERLIIAKTLLDGVIKDLPSVQPEITEEDVKKYCRERCLAIVDGELYEEMKARWSQPELPSCGYCSFAKCTIDDDRPCSMKGVERVERLNKPTGGDR